MPECSGAPCLDSPGPWGVVGLTFLKSLTPAAVVVLAIVLVGTVFLFRRVRTLTAHLPLQGSHLSAGGSMFGGILRRGHWAAELLGRAEALSIHSRPRPINARKPGVHG